MQNMSHEERVEFIAEVVAEIALTKSSTKFWLAATGKALNAAGKGVRKIAQVVEAEAGKPKAVAVTPEGMMLDAAKVVEAEANPIAEIAKLQEGAAVEGRAAQGMQAAEDAAKVTEPGQVHEVTAAEGAPFVERIQPCKFTDFAEGKLQEHYSKHVIEQGEWGADCTMTTQDYLKKAQDLLNSPAEGDIEGFVSKNGYTFRYNKVTNEFATAKPNGTIETFYRPKRGLEYWLEQIVKYK